MRSLLMIVWIICFILPIILFVMIPTMPFIVLVGMIVGLEIISTLIIFTMVDPF
jgi:hypothetical protein